MATKRLKMPDINLNMPMKVLSEDGETYEVDVWKPDVNDVKNLWDKYSNYKVLFDDFIADDPVAFATWVMAKSTVVCTVTAKEPVGVLYVTNIRPHHSGLGHFFFWDRRTSGRHAVILSALRWGMDTFDLHRIDISVPIYAYAALHRIHKLGFKIEGRKRESILYEGKWADTLQFGILRKEITPESIKLGFLFRSEDEEDWHGLLDDDDELKRKILLRRI